MMKSSGLPVSPFLSQLSLFYITFQDTHVLQPVVKSPGFAPASASKVFRPTLISVTASMAHLTGLASVLFATEASNISLLG